MVATKHLERNRLDLDRHDLRKMQELIADLRAAPVNIDVYLVGDDAARLLAEWLSHPLTKALLHKHYPRIFIEGGRGKSGRPRTASNNPNAVQLVSDYIASGLSVKKACAKAAPELGIAAGTLRNLYYQHKKCS